MVSPVISRRQALSGNTAVKAPVTVVATSNVTQSGEQTIDGIALLAENAAGVPDRVLCTAQTDATTNGIWDVQTSAWTRSPDADATNDLANGTQVVVARGTAAKQVWVLTSSDPVVVGTSSLTWSQNLSAGFLATLAGAGGPALIGAQRSDLTHAPFLNLQKWIDRDVANIRRCAIPSTYDWASTSSDAAPYINNLIADLEALGDGYKIEFDGSDLWRLKSPLVLNSDHNTGIVVRDLPRLIYTGTTMDGTSDDGSHAMIYFSGTDHAFGGIDGDGVLQIDADSKANHCVYWEGSWNSGFKMRRMHAKGALIDILRHKNSGTAGPVLAGIEDCSFFPATAYTFSGSQAVCGGSPIHITLNNSTGALAIRRISTDSGVTACIKVDASTFAGTDLFLDEVRMECYKANSDGIVLDYGSAASFGRLTMRNCKIASAGSGSLRALIRNQTSAAGALPVIRVFPFASNDTMTDVYTHTNDTTKSVTYDNKRLGSDLIINATAQVGTLPRASALPTTPVEGDVAYDPTNEQLLIGAPTGGVGTVRRVRAGRSAPFGPSTTPQTVAESDTDKLWHNGNMGTTLVVNLPAISVVGTGWKTPLMATATSQRISITPTTSDQINFKGAGVAYSSSASAGNSIQLMSGPSNNWLIASQVGAFST